MRVLKRILIGFVVAMAVLTGVGLLLPRHVQVVRSISVAAPPATLFAVLNSFKMFNRWSPWVDLDPAARYTFEGPERGVGAKLIWEGDPGTVGSGSQTIIESRAPELIRTDLDFGAEGNAEARLLLEPEEGGTRVTWRLDADMGMNPVGRYFGLAFDRMMGPDYERGLARLKRLAEGLPKEDFSDLAVEEVDVPSVTVAYVAASCGNDEAEISRTLDASYAQVSKFLAAHRLARTSRPLIINRKWGDSGYEFDAAVPVDRAPAGDIPDASPVKVKQTYSGKALKVVHIGAYRNMDSTYRKLHAYAAAHAWEIADSPWDEYVSDPAKTPEPELVTNIFLPVR